MLTWRLLFNTGCADVLLGPAPRLIHSPPPLPLCSPALPGSTKHGYKWQKFKETT